MADFDRSPVMSRGRSASTEAAVESELSRDREDDCFALALLLMLMDARRLERFSVLLRWAVSPVDLEGRPKSTLRRWRRGLAPGPSTVRRRPLPPLPPPTVPLLTGNVPAKHATTCALRSTLEAKEALQLGHRSPDAPESVRGEADDDSSLPDT